MNIQIYTDGACSGNPVGAGSWASVFVVDDAIIFTKTGVLTNVTANRAELQAAYEAIKHVSNEGKFYSEIHVFSDSAYVVNSINKNYLNSWVNKGWKNSEGIDIKHKDLWAEIHAILKTHRIKFYKIRGHSGDVLNCIADQLAKSELKKYNDAKYHASRIKLAKTIEASI
jgi:ribonuclease HI